VTLEPRPLPEYLRVDRGGRSALVNPNFAPHLTVALLEHRRAVRFAETPAGRVEFRPCRRRGAVGALFGEGFVGINGPVREFTLHREAYARGVDTPLPVGVIWRHLGPFVLGAIATLDVDAVDLIELTRSDRKPDLLDFAACGRAICSMHAAGFVHADLQLRNLLARNGRAWIVGFAGARIVSEVGRVHARANFLRLKKSFQRRRLPILFFDAVRDAYEAAGGVKIPL
jgi:hypothetical protein